MKTPQARIAISKHILRLNPKQHHDIGVFAIHTEGLYFKVTEAHTREPMIYIELHRDDALALRDAINDLLD